MLVFKSIFKWHRLKASGKLLDLDYSIHAILVYNSPILCNRSLDDLREVYMPVIWFGVRANLSDKLLGWIHFSLIGPYIGSFCFFLAFVTCMVVVARSGMKYAKMKKDTPTNIEGKVDEEHQAGEEVKND